MRNKLIFIFAVLVLMASLSSAAEIVKDINFDKKNGGVSYVLTRPSFVRVSLGVEGGPMFVTLVDWHLRKRGAHKEEWNKTGINEIDNLLCNQKTFFTFNYFTYGLQESGLDINSLLEEESLIGPIGRSSTSVDLNRLHKEHRREFCREPKVLLTLPENISKTKEGVPIINRPISLTIEIDSKDKNWFNRERYSLYIFIDAVFVQGALEGFSPYHWRFDPKGLNKGVHLITVNLRGLSDHLGIALLPIYVDS